VHCTSDSSKFMINVTDTGIGIPQVLLNQLFQLGSSTSRPGTTGEKGAGLGLMIVHELVEANRGGLSITSKEGVGTTFTIILPRSQSIIQAIQPEQLYS